MGTPRYEAGGAVDLSGVVPKTTTVNGHALSSNVTLTTADIADSTDKRYVTDAELTVIAATSGTNTGDQNLSAYALLTSSITDGDTTHSPDGNSVYDALALKMSASATTDSVTEGATNLYHTAARVRATVLTGLSLATSQVIAATDTVLQALGYLQAQITLRATKTKTITTVSATTYTLLGTEEYILFTAGSAVTFTCNTAQATTGYTFTICQNGAGQVSWAGTATARNADGHTKTYGQYSEVTFTCNVSGEFQISGRTA